MAFMCQLLPRAEEGKMQILALKNPQVYREEQRHKCHSCVQGTWETRKGALCTVEDGGDCQRSPEGEQALKVGLEQQQSLHGGKRYGGQVNGVKEHSCLQWTESTLSGLSMITGNRKRKGRGEVKRWIKFRLSRA